MPVVADAQQTSWPDRGSRQDGVVQGRDHLLRFSHVATTHHFHLLKDGGEIVVTASDPSGKSSIEEIRMHLMHIARMFSGGNFNAPRMFHDTTVHAFLLI